jgi:hypothetical protein
VAQGPAAVGALKLAAFFFGYGKTAGEKARLRQMFDLAGFRPSNNQQLKFVLEIEDFKQRSEVLLDTRLSEAQKNEKLSDLRDRYSRLTKALQAPGNLPPLDRRLLRSASSHDTGRHHGSQGPDRRRQPGGTQLSVPGRAREFFGHDRHHRGR